ncbi:MAG: anthranilate synthase component I [Thermodesulfovibrionales bacterium]|nr:anthranilate synthase component I [Thermodesulfovibrionales bacterium]
MNITFKEFQALSQQGNIIPLYKEILGDIETPVNAYLKLNKRPSFLLESVLGGEMWARYSFIGVDPTLIVISKDNSFIITSQNSSETLTTTDPLNSIREILRKFKPVPVKGLPRFTGGLVGYIGYDVVKFFERVPDYKKPCIDMPDIYLMLADNILIFDNLKQTIKIVHNAHINNEDVKTIYRRAEKHIDSIIEILKNGGNTKALNSPTINYQTMHTSKVKFLNRSLLDSNIEGQFFSNFTKIDFMKAVENAKEYIKAGDIIQVVLSQRFQKVTNSSPFTIYRAIRLINPSPYMYYIDSGDFQIVGSSPEILVRLEGDKIILRPIAGTRRRGESEEEDKLLEESLKKDPKEIAEHIMLVDLGRNDVGRVAEVGSVKVTELMSIEKYSHVMHLVSNVEGKLRRGLDAFDVLRSCFPAGTVTGAPKVRAMEIIEELEPVRRGPYAGAVGYISYNGNMDTCITIRTTIVKGETIYIQAGAGIVADSIAEEEYLETVNKATAMMKAIEFFQD